MDATATSARVACGTTASAWLTAPRRGGNNLKHCDGGLAPTSGPVRFGHQCTGLGVKSPEGPNQRRVPYLAQRTENFIGCGPLPPEEVKTRKHAQYKSEAPYANHFKDTEYSVTTHNQVFGIGGERRHVEPEDPAKDPRDTSHLFRRGDSPPPRKERSRSTAGHSRLASSAASCLPAIDRRIPPGDGTPSPSPTRRLSPTSSARTSITPPGRSTGSAPSIRDSRRATSRARPPIASAAACPARRWSSPLGR